MVMRSLVGNNRASLRAKENKMTSSEGMQHVCEFCGHDFGKEPQSTHHCNPRHVLERIKLKPRTTVKRFSLDLKARIERAARAFDDGGSEYAAVGARYVLGIVDAALSDYDVRDPGDMK
jgi:hypothetical protein